MPAAPAARRARTRGRFAIFAGHRLGRAGSQGGGGFSVAAMRRGREAAVSAQAWLHGRKAGAAIEKS